MAQRASRGRPSNGRKLYDPTQDALVSVEVEVQGDVPKSTANSPQLYRPPVLNASQAKGNNGPRPVKGGRGQISGTATKGAVVASPQQGLRLHRPPAKDTTTPSGSKGTAPRTAGKDFSESPGRGRSRSGAPTQTPPIASYSAPPQDPRLYRPPAHHSSSSKHGEPRSARPDGPEAPSRGPARTRGRNPAIEATTNGPSVPKSAKSQGILFVPKLDSSTKSSPQKSGRSKRAGGPSSTSGGLKTPVASRSSPATDSLSPGLTGSTSHSTTPRREGRAVAAQTQAESVPQPLNPPGLLARPCRNALSFLTRQMKIDEDSVVPFLSPATQHQVIGTLGAKGTGKSTLLSLVDSGFPTPAPSKDRAIQGAELFITPRRYFLIDTLSLFDSSSWERAFRRLITATDMGPSQWYQLQYYQLSHLLLSTCDVLLVPLQGEKLVRPSDTSVSTVQLGRDNKRVLRFLATAITLYQRHTLVTSGLPGFVDRLDRRNRLPEIYLVVNRCPAWAYLNSFKPVLENTLTDLIQARSDSSSLDDPSSSPPTTSDLPLHIHFLPDQKSVIYSPATSQPTPNSSFACFNPFDPAQPYNTHQPGPVTFTMATEDFLGRLRQSLRHRITHDTRVPAFVSNPPGSHLPLHRASGEGPNPELSWLRQCVRLWENIRRSDDIRQTVFQL
ncbi:hypothetical protein BJ085DRAFT_40461 [Dimargaris cristalligena]|uniref:Uncharacterized protein n=1 Tax=Dimargaris cristalligena TaxID=215637 RepID=A0A4P9ZRJ0_9FUNG|nr:hypothetical protein BJ085DRAFT_40461 [Dimargaris cristalligena]|eukprot:RKP35060.1 hypothetical protein BJ085DRAFT_40461 [Dimargaris cristalligena]